MPSDGAQFDIMIEKHVEGDAVHYDISFGMRVRLADVDLVRTRHEPLSRAVAGAVVDKLKPRLADAFGKAFGEDPAETLGRPAVR